MCLPSPGRQLGVTQARAFYFGVLSLLPLCFMGPGSLPLCLPSGLQALPVAGAGHVPQTPCATRSLCRHLMTAVLFVSFSLAVPRLISLGIYLQSHCVDRVESKVIYRVGAGVWEMPASPPGSLNQF